VYEFGDCCGVYSITGNTLPNVFPIPRKFDLQGLYLLG